jgi:hypothetical protein
MNTSFCKSGHNNPSPNKLASKGKTRKYARKLKSLKENINACLGVHSILLCHEMIKRIVTGQDGT